MPKEIKVIASYIRVVHLCISRETSGTEGEKGSIGLTGLTGSTGLTGPKGALRQKVVKGDYAERSGGAVYISVHQLHTLCTLEELEDHNMINLIVALIYNVCH